nr:uncharacterized protein LOC109158743 [Ipomoea batatas]
MLSSSSENQPVAGALAEEIDLLRRNKKKTKRGLSERDNDPMEMEGEDTVDLLSNGNNPANEQSGLPSNTVKRPTISFKFWGKGENSKGRYGGNQGGNGKNFNKEGFKIWNNSRYGVLDNLEEDEETNEEDFTEMNGTDGSTGTTLAGRGKRAQIQTTEAQITNDKSANDRGNTKGGQNVQKDREGTRGTVRTNKQINQAAETDNHTVVRGYEMGSRVEKTIINEEGSMTEVQHTQEEAGEHHQDPPPDGGNLMDSGGNGDPMMDVEFTEGQSSEVGGETAL